MATARAKSLTLLQLSDWLVLYDGQYIKLQESVIDLIDLHRIVGKSTFRLHVIDAQETPLDDYLSEHGEIQLSLDDAKQMIDEDQDGQD